MLKLPIDGKRLGLAGGVGFRQATRQEGARTAFAPMSALAAFRPADDAELLLFRSHIFMLSDEARPIYFPAGLNSPPKFRAPDFAGSIGPSAIDPRSPWRNRGFGLAAVSGSRRTCSIR